MCLCLHALPSGCLSLFNLRFRNEGKTKIEKEMELKSLFEHGFVFSCNNVTMFGYTGMGWDRC